MPYAYAYRIQSNPVIFGVLCLVSCPLNAVALGPLALRVRPWAYGSLSEPRASAAGLVIKAHTYAILSTGGRKTRSGHEFSPFSMVMGPPIYARPDFDLAGALKRSNEERMAREDIGEESADEHEVEDAQTLNGSPSTSSEVLGQATLLAPAPAVAPTVPKRTRKQQHAKEVRRRKRANKQSLASSDLKSVTLKRRRGLIALETDLPAEELGAASSGWIGGRVPVDKTSYTLDEVTNAPYNLRHFRWDGR